MLIIYTLIHSQVTNGLKYIRLVQCLECYLHATYRCSNFYSIKRANEDDSKMAASGVVTSDEPDVSYNYTNLMVYCGLVVLVFVLGMSRALLFWNQAMTAAANLHSKMLQSIMRSPVRFFDTNPSGTC